MRHSHACYAYTTFAVYNIRNINGSIESMRFEAALRSFFFYYPTTHTIAKSTPTQTKFISIRESSGAEIERSNEKCMAACISGMALHGRWVARATHTKTTKTKKKKLSFTAAMSMSNRRDASVCLCLCASHAVSPTTNIVRLICLWNIIAANVRRVSEWFMNAAAGHTQHSMHNLLARMNFH